MFLAALLMATQLIAAIFEWTCTLSVGGTIVVAEVVIVFSLFLSNDVMFVPVLVPSVALQTVDMAVSREAFAPFSSLLVDVIHVYLVFSGCFRNASVQWIKF